MRNRTIVWVLFYASTLVAAGGAIWFVGDLNANNWVAPSIAPPAWLFGPVWTTLYLMIATSGYRISRVRSSDLKSMALGLWALQMCLNTLWTPVFFGLQRIKAGMAVLLMLWAAVAACMVALWQVDMLAGLLFIPYLVWVSVAAALNAAVWRLNPENLGENKT